MLPPPFVDCKQAHVNVKMCLSMMVRVQTNSSSSYVPHFLPLVHLSNPDELYNLHLKLILLSHDHLQNLETVHLYLLHPAERTKLSDFIPHQSRFVKLTSRHTCS